MLNPLNDFLAQKVILLMTGVPGTVAMRDEVSQLIKKGDSNKVSTLINEVMAARVPVAPGEPAEAAVQYVLDSGFSINLPPQKIGQITADSLRQGIESWTGLFSYAMDKVDNNVGKILGNRAEAADVFTGLVDELDVDVNVDHSLVQEWIDKIDASDESLSEAKDTVKDLIDELTTLPVLVDSNPSDDSTEIAIGQDIVLTFNKKVTAGSGDILIVGSDGDTRTIAVTDNSQVTITGKTLILNPIKDLNKDTVYYVQLESGVIKDLVGHAFAGISDDTTLNFITASGFTFTLTTGTDNIPGSSDNDTILGEFSAEASLTTINPADEIGGGGGADTFKVFGNFDAATTVLPTSISSVETLHLAKLANAAQDLSTLTKAVTGIEKIEVGDASLLNAKTITTLVGQSLSLATAAGVGTAGGVTWAGSATDTTLNLALNGYQGAATATPAALTVTGAAATTLNIASTSGNNVVSAFIGPTTVTSHVISGDKALTYTLAAADAAKLSSIDASTNTGGVTVIDNAALTKTGFTFIGGTGNDTISFINDAFGTLTAGTQLKGGDGVDKIGLFDTAVSASEAAKIQAAVGFEKIGLNATITLDARALSNYKTFDIDTTGLTQVINELATGRTVNVGAGAAAAFTATSLTTAGAVGISDVTVNLGGAGDLFAHTITTLVTTGLTNVNLSSNGTVANTITGITNSDNSKFAVTGSADLTMALAAGTAIASQVDASAFTGKLTVTGSSMTGSGDRITGGSGADTINGLKGADILTGGGGADNFTFTSTAGANTNGVTFGTFDEIKDFVAGTDKLQFSNTDVVSAQQAAVQTAVTALAASSTAAQIATVMSAANTTNLGVSFAVYEGNTYVLYETTGAAATGTVADDVFIKLTGVTALPTFVGDVIV